MTYEYSKRRNEHWQYRYDPQIEIPQNVTRWYMGQIWRLLTNTNPTDETFSPRINCSLCILPWKRTTLLCYYNICWRLIPQQQKQNNECSMYVLWNLLSIVYQCKKTTLFVIKGKSQEKTYVKSEGEGEWIIGG